MEYTETEGLLKEWLVKTMGENEIPMLSEFLMGCKGDMPRLYRMYEGLWSKQLQIHPVGERFMLTIDPAGTFLMSDTGKIEHTLEEWKKIIGKGIAFLEELLPLGSVVVLKKEYLQSRLSGVERPDAFRLVITDRYLSLTGHSYFPYGGVPYPTGDMGTQRKLLFSPALIADVLSRGYSDEQEAEYQYRMKREYLLDKDMDMCGFETPEERAAVRQKMEEAYGR